MSIVKCTEASKPLYLLPGRQLTVEHHEPRQHNQWLGTSDDDVWILLANVEASQHWPASSMSIRRFQVRALGRSQAILFVFEVVVAAAGQEVEKIGILPSTPETNAPASAEGGRSNRRMPWTILSSWVAVGTVQFRGKAP
ncbi:hypothetical protein KC344_g196 [Hortaea werneckii]|nr:hypothetical protein KC344_g196 [Hortaea werneckii]